MTTETSNARGEWPARYACNGPEGTFWTDDATLANKLIASAFDRDEWTVTDTQNLTAAAPQPAPARGDVRYDRELIAQMLDAAEAPAFTKEEMDTQARLLREAAQAKPEARGVVDGESRSVTSQLLHWCGIPVYVTGTVTTSPGNWPLIDAALMEARNVR